MTFFPVNIVAVLVGAVITFALGGLWYSSVLFAGPWMAVVGKSKEELRASASPAVYVSAFLSGLVSVYVLALVIEATNVSLWWSGMLTGFLCWMGFAAATSHAHTVFGGRPLKLWTIDTGYNLVCFLTNGVLLALWR